MSKSDSEWFIIIFENCITVNCEGGSPVGKKLYWEKGRVGVQKNLFCGKRGSHLGGYLNIFTTITQIEHKRKKKKGEEGWVTDFKLHTDAYIRGICLRGRGDVPIIYLFGTILY